MPCVCGGGGAWGGGAPGSVGGHRLLHVTVDQEIPSSQGAVGCVREGPDGSCLGGDMGDWLWPGARVGGQSGLHMHAGMTFVGAGS